MLERNDQILKSIEDEYRQFDDLAALTEKAEMRAKQKEALERQRTERAYQRMLTLKKKNSKFYKEPSAEEIAAEQAKMESELQ